MGAVHIPIIDEDKLDNIITAIQALSAPSGTNVAISPTGMHIVTEDDVQGAISELDAEAYAVNQSLTQSLKAQQVQFVLPQTVTINANSSGILLDHFDLSASTATDAVFTNKTLAQLFGGHTILGVVGIWCSSGLIPLETIVWAGTNELTIRFYNQSSVSITVSAVRLLVLYS